MSVNATFAVAARTRKVSRRPCTCPTTGNILILHKTLLVAHTLSYDRRLAQISMLPSGDRKQYACVMNHVIVASQTLWLVLRHHVVKVTSSVFKPTINDRCRDVEEENAS